MRMENAREMRNSQHFIWHKDIPFRKVRLWLAGISLCIGIVFVVCLVWGLAMESKLLQYLTITMAVMEIVIGTITMGVIRVVDQGSKKG
jgi:hypothetical protein